MKTISLKTISIFVFLIIMSIPGKSQSKAVDEIFKKFDGKNGVTTVNVSKDLMDLAAQMDSGKSNGVFSQISGLKILTFEKALPEDKVAFENMVKALPLDEYKELMVVKEKDQNVKMLLKEKNGKISEFLLLVTGGNEPVLISIGGNIDPKELGKLAGSMKLNGFEHLAKLNKH